MFVISINSFYLNTDDSVYGIYLCKIAGLG